MTGAAVEHIDGSGMVISKFMIDCFPSFSEGTPGRTWAAAREDQWCRHGHSRASEWIRSRKESQVRLKSSTLKLADIESAALR